MRVDAKTEASVKSVLDELVEWVRARDLEKMTSLFVSDPDVLVYGVGIEKRIGIDAIKDKLRADWSLSDSVRLHIEWTSTSGSEDAVWVAAEGYFVVGTGDAEVVTPTRMTLVIIRSGARWKIVQLHMSLNDEREVSEDRVTSTRGTSR